MIIVLDTNPIRAHLPLDSPLFRQLSIFVKNDGHRLVVPEVVLKELNSQVSAEFRKVQRALDSFKQATRYTGDITPIGEVERQRFTATLHQRLTGIGAEIIPIPPIPHTSVIDRIYERKAPFGTGDKPSESGYKDFLVWRTVFALACDGSGQQVVLVTADKDFGQNNTLHRDLAADVLGLDVRLVSDLRTFHEKVVQPWFRSDERLRDQLVHKIGELTDFIQRYPEEAWFGFLIGSSDLDLPYPLDGAEMTVIDEVTDVRVSSVRRLNDDEIAASLLLEGHFGMTSVCSSSDPEDFHELDYSPLNFDVDIVDGDYAIANFNVHGTASFDIVLRIENDEIREPKAVELTEFLRQPVPTPSDSPLSIGSDGEGARG